MFQIRHAWHIQVRRILSINTNEKAQVVAIRYPEWLGRNLCYYRRNQMEIGFSKFRLVSLTPAFIKFVMHQISNLQHVFFAKVVLGSDLWRWLNEDLESWVSESKSPAVKRFETTVGCKVQKLGTAKGAGVTRKVWENPWIVLYCDFCCLLSKGEEI